MRKLDNDRYLVEDYYGFAWEGLRVYNYEEYIDEAGETKIMTSEKYDELIDKKNTISRSSKF